MARQNLRTLSVLYDDTSDFNLDVVKGVQEWAQRFKIDIVFQRGYQDGATALAGLLAECTPLNAHGLILSGG